jgi:hypothetical protein
MRLLLGELLSSSAMAQHRMPQLAPQVVPSASAFEQEVPDFRNRKQSQNGSLG